MEYSFISTKRELTVRLGEFIAPKFVAGDVVLLEGDLGAGKTTLVGGVAKALKVDDDVISPTFNIMKCYFNGTLPLYHIDAYRLENQNIELGLDEYIEGNGVCFIEWPQYIKPLIPDERMSIKLVNIGGDQRKITLSSDTPRFVKIIKDVEGEF
ncbi:MAG: tRNA (adenosine(37)-N6)-threonylcarbamoyltransferase complex ATPase subunit type 1 TsaE [Bacilli bacterium]|jgi:tRNA threonylcarbamoyladenosine biosynthesis protein TsaE|nr:tRNA (adenosine(37)-N6)-threonylcarbamoyltransferase complex ATPase subunit type 1 TsaE [Bacilli bacterium]MCH4210553.1 tRNA (adenosine(37)-N6)-threonylcarbamoyltransferase complex ATPase subunit type 1 TsaE [Bacilli bacterium]MCH4228804.1 tRNA (adenosine(37)-N6)-threonylcarbamoyltransferase complex ATPase subunit type 1 TsaE [Bacilli bacterium]MCH4277399.1 tRNA (adenosine(37)-N6)-threonylcarbamoyltransferase complex ATPase subunit type 1 TsaE [Bacilli bacterium]